MSGTWVLVVSPQNEERAAIAGWLEEEGFRVRTCPGPCEPDLTCPGGRWEPCPIAGDVPIVVLDLMLASDELLVGTAGWELLLYYTSLGKKIVALWGQDDPVRPQSDEQVSIVRRPADRGALLASVRAFAGVPVG